ALAAGADAAAGLAREQGPEAGVHTLDVTVVERHGQQLVDMPEQVLDVGARRGGMGEVQVPGGVGGADDPVAPPRDDEQHRLLGPGDEAALGADPLAWHDEVDALAG